MEGIAYDMRLELIWNLISMNGHWIPDGYEVGTTRMG
jgi:hypothetical protein